MASSEPSASPSGPSWVVSRKRSAAANLVGDVRRVDAPLRSATVAHCLAHASSSLEMRTPRSGALVVVEGQGRACA